MLGYVVLTLLLFLAGVLAGIKMAWLDAYEKGRRDVMRSNIAVALRVIETWKSQTTATGGAAVSTWPPAPSGSARIGE